MTQRQVIFPDLEGFNKPFSIAKINLDNTDCQSQIVALAQKIGGEYLATLIAKRVKDGFRVLPPYSRILDRLPATEVTPPLSEELIAALKYQWIKPAFDEWSADNQKNVWDAIQERLGVDRERFEKIARGIGGTLNNREWRKLNFLLEGAEPAKSPAQRSETRVTTWVDMHGDPWSLCSPQR
ncbi:MAG: hypothetical protein PHS79_03860 [Patescibacteria group bacterium]|nr:hypothetical protein [Patescibacteria group bacterium]